MSYSADREDNFFEYSMTIRTPSKDSMSRLPDYSFGDRINNRIPHSSDRGLIQLI